MTPPLPSLRARAPSYPPSSMAIRRVIDRFSPSFVDKSCGAGRIGGLKRQTAEKVLRLEKFACHFYRAGVESGGRAQKSPGLRRRNGDNSQSLSAPVLVG